MKVSLFEKQIIWRKKLTFHTKLCRMLINDLWFSETNSD